MIKHITRVVLAALLVFATTPYVAGQGPVPPNKIDGLLFMAHNYDFTTGEIFFVDDSGSDSVNGGRDPSEPFATTDYAVGRCALATQGGGASTGCTIYLMPGHAENLIAVDSVDIDVAGISVIGLATGSLRPTFTMTTAIAGEYNVDAANHYLANVIFVVDVATTAVIELTANADGFHADNIMIREGANEPAIMIDMVGQADDVLIENSTFLVPTAGDGATGIDLSALTPARFTFINNVVRGDFNVAALLGSGAITDMLIDGNVFENALAGQLALEFSGAALGIISNNLLISSTALTTLDAGSANLFNNYWSVGIDRASVPFPINQEFFAGLGYRVQKVADYAADPDDLFSVTGVILLTYMVGEVTTAVATTTTLTIETDTNTEQLHAATTITTDPAGTLYILPGDPGSVLNCAAAPVVDLAACDAVGTTAIGIHPYVVGLTAGTTVIRAQLNATATGGHSTTWTMFYIPISANASVVAL